MSIAKPNKTVTLQQEERTCCIVIQCIKNTDYSVEFQREAISHDGGTGKVYERLPMRTSRRNLSTIAATEVTLQSGKVLTGAEIAEALSKLGDAFATEDANNAQNDNPPV